jgi:protease inhibitor Inh
MNRVALALLLFVCAGANAAGQTLNDQAKAILGTWEFSSADARGKSLAEFSEVETGMFEAPTPGYGVLFLQNAADVGSQPVPIEQVVGEWVLMRGNGKPLCSITLSTAPAEEGFALTVKPGCDPTIARLNFKRWQIDRDELMLSPARGNAWRFEQNDANSWQRVPESANSYTLVRQ